MGKTAGQLLAEFMKAREDGESQEQLDARTLEVANQASRQLGGVEVTVSRPDGGKPIKSSAES